MHIVSVVLIFDTCEICLVFCKHKLTSTASKYFGQVFVYKILSKYPMFHISKQQRQYTEVQQLLFFSPLTSGGADVALMSRALRATLDLETRLPAKTLRERALLIALKSSRA